VTSSRGAEPAARPAPLAVTAWGLLGSGCAAAVATSGELALGSLVGVMITGTVVAGVGLFRRTGAGSPSGGRPPTAWLVAGVTLAVFEVVALVHDGVPTVSDLADPALAAPVVRAAATVLWCALGAWLVVRPRGPVAGAMRQLAGRLAVLASWLWLGVHFLAR
jgi:Family of unknown function (DUF6186)